MGDLDTRIASVKLRIRSAPNTQSNIVGYIEAGSSITPIALVTGESIAGNVNWYQLPGGGFVYGGYTVSGAAAPPRTMDVPRRSDNNAVNVLSSDERERYYGKFGWSEAAQKGAIVIDPAWVSANITEITVPLPCHPKLTVHKLAAGPFGRVFDKLAAANLTDHILTMDGTWVPRHMRWLLTTPLSSHSWGIAIDLNARWNRQGDIPVAIGETGSVRELLNIFESEGFAWGGHFQPLAFTDGMHFELARRDLGTA